MPLRGLVHIHQFEVMTTRSRACRGRAAQLYEAECQRIQEKLAKQEKTYQIFVGNDLYGTASSSVAAMLMRRKAMQRYSKIYQITLRVL